MNILAAIKETSNTHKDFFLRYIKKRFEKIASNVNDPESLWLEFMSHLQDTMLYSDLKQSSLLVSLVLFKTFIERKKGMQKITNEVVLYNNNIELVLQPKEYDIFTNVISQLEKINEQYSSISFLHFWHGYNPAEIADLTSIDKFTVDIELKNIRVFVFGYCLGKYGFTNEWKLSDRDFHKFLEISRSDTETELPLDERTAVATLNEILVNLTIQHNDMKDLNLRMASLSDKLLKYSEINNY